MSISGVIMIIMSVFFVIGALDRLFPAASVDIIKM